MLESWACTPKNSGQNKLQNEDIHNKCRCGKLLGIHPPAAGYPVASIARLTAPMTWTGASRGRSAAVAIQSPGSGVISLVQLDLGVSINRGTPIAGWSIS